MAERKLPVHIITGFLGAGKTSFLNHFIRELPEDRILVIENEVGQTNVDSNLVMEGVDEVLELSAGCLCCSLSDGLLDLLNEIRKNKDKYDRIVIETTGVADPSSIAQVFLNNSWIEHHFDIRQVISLVDAGNIRQWLTETEEALRQIVMADVILINKTDTVTPAELEETQSYLSQITPNALVLTGDQGKFPIDQLLSEGLFLSEPLEKRLSEVSVIPEVTSDQDSPATNNAHRITTFTLTFDRPFDMNMLSMHLYRLVNLYRDQVYRIKGILVIEGLPNRAILQSVRTSCIISDGSDWEEGEERVSKLVFIGRGLKREAFEKMFIKYLRSPA